MGNTDVSKPRSGRHKHDRVSLRAVEDPHAEWVANFANKLLAACVVICVLVAFIELT
jgi:hypothetical protein